MERPPLWQTKIPAIENKWQYLQLMEEMSERWARQLEGRKLDIHINEMHAHMRGTELKEEEEELHERELQLPHPLATSWFVQKRRRSI
jgi:hypothetical protein